MKFSIHIIVKHVGCVHSAAHIASYSNFRIAELVHKWTKLGVYFLINTRSLQKKKLLSRKSILHAVFLIGI